MFIICVHDLLARAQLRASTHSKQELRNAGELCAQHKEKVSFGVHIASLCHTWLLPSVSSLMFAEV